MHKYKFLFQVLLILPFWILAILKVFIAIPLYIIAWCNDLTGRIKT